MMQHRQNIILGSGLPGFYNSGKRKGLLIAFEGVDGTGKSTQARMLAEALQASGRSVVLTREPTDGTYGQKIRRLFTARGTVSRIEELELFLADRREHVDRVIAPALAAGEIVITDRYYLSTVAYQGAAGLDPTDILRRNEEFAPYPDLFILLVLPVAEGLDRIQVLRRETLNDFEQAGSLGLAAQIFDSLQGEAIRRVDGSSPPETVHQEVLRLVMPVLSRH